MCLVEPIISPIDAECGHCVQGVGVNLYVEIDEVSSTENGILRQGLKSYNGVLERESIKDILRQKLNRITD